MSFLDRIFKRQTVNQTHPRDPVLAEWFGGGEAVAVNAKTAMGVPAVYACVNVLSETIAALPLGVWRIDGDNRVEEADHPLSGLLKGKPCDWMTAFEWMEWQVQQTALRGDAFNQIVTDSRGRVTAIVPLDYTNCSLDFSTGRQRLHVKRQGQKDQTLLDDETLRLPWKVQADGMSISPVGVQRESFATAIAARRYQQKLMQNNAAPKGGVKSVEALSPEAAEALIRSWEQRHQGPENAGKLAIFDGGLDWVNIGMSNEDAQFVELMQLSIQDAARIFRVQPHKIGDLSRATFSNIEHQGIEFLTDTILPWVRRIEARMENWLLSEPERRQLSIEFNLRGLLRADATARGELYSKLFYASAISPNEIRRMEGMNPIEGGDRFYLQQATIPADLIDDVVSGNTPLGENNVQ